MKKQSSFARELANPYADMEQWTGTKSESDSVSFFGALSAQKKTVFGKKKPLAKVTLFLKWSQWLRAEAAAAGETLLFVNLDETAVAQLVPHRRGCVMPAGTGARASPVERIKRSESHGHLTLMAAIAGDADLQACLPQWVLPKDAGLTRAERARMRRLADPLVFVPGTSGWVSVESLCPLLTHLRRVVRARRPGHRLVVAWDAASQHVNILVLRHARRLGIHVLLIPAGLTWLLQPLDSHVFASFKRTAHRLQLEARASKDAGVLQRTGWIDLLETSCSRDACAPQLGTIVGAQWCHGRCVRFVAARPRVLAGRKAARRGFSERRRNVPLAWQAACRAGKAFVFSVPSRARRRNCR